MENKLKIVFAGSPKSSSTILQSLIDNNNWAFSLNTWKDSSPGDDSLDFENISRNFEPNLLILYLILFKKIFPLFPKFQ